MSSTKHKSAVKKIKDFFESKGYRCKENVSVVRNKKNPIDSEVGKIDLCCQKDNSLFCAEVESSGKQVIKNKRDLEEMQRQAEKKGIRFTGCQIADDEDFKEVCK
ncbi:hypothetical protein ES703_88050 [subsurface metagenome]